MVYYLYVDGVGMWVDVVSGCVGVLGGADVLLYVCVSGYVQNVYIVCNIFEMIVQLLDNEVTSADPGFLFSI